MYAGAPLSLGAFRRRLPERRPAVRAAGGRDPGSRSAFAISGLIILWSGWDTDWKLGIAILIGYVILAVNLIFDLNDKPVHLNLKGAAWLPVYLVGMGVITYISSFGPMDDPVLGDYLGIIVTVLFSAAIYYWAMAVALPPEEIEEMVSEVVLPEEEGLEMPSH